MFDLVDNHRDERQIYWVYSVNGGVGKSKCRDMLQKERGALAIAAQAPITMFNRVYAY